MTIPNDDPLDMDLRPVAASNKDCTAAQRALDYYLKPTVSVGSADAPALEDSLFEVKAGISGEEAMIHASDLLRCAAAAAYESAGSLNGTPRDLAFSVVYMIDLAKAMVDRSLNGNRTA